MRQPCLRGTPALMVALPSTYRKSRRDFAAWAAVLALVFQAALPTAASAFSDPDSTDPFGGFMVICTPDGLQTIAFDLSGATGNGTDPLPVPMAFDHCTSCCLGGAGLCGMGFVAAGVRQPVLFLVARVSDQPDREQRDSSRPPSRAPPAA